LIAPTTTDSRITTLGSTADSFIYVVSVTGVTGARDAVSNEVPALIERIRKNLPEQAKSLPLAVGFGVATRDSFLTVANAGSEGVVIGSGIIKVLKNAGKFFLIFLSFFFIALFFVVILGFMRLTRTAPFSALQALARPLRLFRRTLWR
jgi:hypothetical protein